LAIGKSKIKPLLTAVEKAFKQLHTKGSYKPEDLAKTAEYKNLISGTSQIFNSAITDNDIPEAMAKSLKADVFLFSGLKTHAQLAEASKLLLTPEGKIKSFSIFSNDLKSIKENYNQNYLEAEYQFAVSSAQSAGNWANLSNDYDLQYRTAEDDRVRDSHDKLKVTLPQDDAFWISYYPPNGWRCRCTAVQVRKGKFEVSDSKKAIAAGELATTKLDKNGKNKLEIFRFNPGIQKVVFPPSHPYTKIAGAETVRKELKKEKTDFIPKELENYEKELGIKINKDIFKFLKKETPLYFTKPAGYKKHIGAYYLPSANFVKIPIDERRKNSKWYAQAVVHHEFGHAIDFQTQLRKSDKVKTVMNDCRKLYSLNKSKELYNIAYQGFVDAHLKKEWDNVEKHGAVLDTIASIRPSINSAETHSKSYWKKEWNPEAEFIAHISENKFSGNDVFEKLMPDLYKKMKGFEFD
jgi:3-methyladenine DNA glycosylase Tag